MPTKDPAKRAAILRRYYDKNKESLRNKGNVFNKQNRDRIKAMIQTSIAEGKPMPDVARTFIAKVLLYQAKWRAKQGGLPFELTLKDISVPDACPVSKERLQINTGRGPASNSPTLDRLVPELGYVSHNIAVISAEANSTKGNKNVEYFERLLAYMKQWQADPLNKPKTNQAENLFNA